MKQKGGLSPEQARRILARNPALRGQGKDTSWVLERANSAWKEADEPKKKAANFESAILTTRAALNAEQQALKERIAAIEKQLAVTKDQAVVHLCAWLEENDPELRSSDTQEAIADFAGFLRDIGFSEERYRGKP